ncbi:MAG TPA: hypothetical protein VGN12_16490 [Pirellulales bacterium]
MKALAGMGTRAAVAQGAKQGVAEAESAGFKDFMTGLFDRAQPRQQPPQIAGTRFADQPRGGLSRLAQFVANPASAVRSAMRPSAFGAPTAPPGPDDRPPGGFAKLAAGNFGDLLGGKVDYAGLMQGERNNRERKEEEDRLKDMNRAMSQLTVGALAAGAGLSNLPRSMKGFANLQLNGQEYLRQFNGRINAAFGQLDYQRVRASQEVGQRTENSTAALAGEMGKFEREFAETRAAVASAVNVVAIPLVEVGRGLNFIARPVVKLVGLLEKLVGKDQGPVADFPHFLNDLQQGRWSGMGRDRLNRDGLPVNERRDQNRARRQRLLQGRQQQRRRK